MVILLYQHLELYGRHNRPTQQTISNTVRKFEETGSVIDIARPVHHRNIRSAENIAVVAQSVEEDPNLSIPRRAQHLGLSYGSYGGFCIWICILIRTKSSSLKNLSLKTMHNAECMRIG